MPTKMQQLLEESKPITNRKNFEQLNINSIYKMTDKELTLWQSKFPSDSPQSLFAFQEFNKRNIIKQIKSTTCITIISTIIIALVTLLSVVLVNNKEPVHTIDLLPQKIKLQIEEISNQNDNKYHLYIHPLDFSTDKKKMKTN